MKLLTALQLLAVSILPIQAAVVSPRASSRQFHTSGWTPKSGDIWVSTKGNDNASGSQSHPLKSIDKALGKAKGKTVWVASGSYSAGKLEYPGNARISGITSGDMPKITLSEAMRINSDGNSIRYLEFTSTGENGCIKARGSNNKLEWLKIHDCGNTGLQLEKGAAHNQVINSDSYLNYDEPKKGENADGFTAKFNIGKGNEFLGCRSFRNSDDGWDFWQAGNDSPVTLKYCWAFNMRHPKGGPAGDGNGFKLGTPAHDGSDGNAPHKLSECFSFYNPASGFSANGNKSGKITCTGCGAWNDGVSWSTGNGGKLPIHTKDVTLKTTPSQAEGAKRDSNGNLPDIEKL